MKVIALLVLSFVFFSCSSEELQTTSERSISSVKNDRVSLKGAVTLDHAGKAFSEACRKLRVNSRFSFRDRSNMVAAVAENEVVSISPSSDSQIRVTRYRINGMVSNRMQLQMSFLKFLDYKSRLQSEGNWNNRGPAQYPGKEGRFKFSSIRANEKMALSDLAQIF
ncbi:MAG: hypothetical protein ACRBF0_00915 [Calditrichia bacterium]